MTAQIVIGLGFGDEGKGKATDLLCSQYPDSIVVRFSGGQQAGHTVMLDGIKHVHSNFGSGTLRGLPSYFSEHCSIYLSTIEKEYSILLDKGCEPVLYVHPLTKVTTPFDVAFNKVREEMMGHGSCGLGIGSTMKRHNETGYKLFAIDLTYPDIFVEKLKAIEEYYYSIVSHRDLVRYNEYLAIEIESFMGNLWRKVVKVANYDKLRQYSNVIFEGSQGVLLDMNHGVFPNVTYAETTSKNAIQICHLLGISPELFYVTRCYQTRHGKGWTSNDKQVYLENTDEEINKPNRWQGDFRVRELDYDMLNYSLSVDASYSYSLDKNLIITCLDQRPDFNFELGRLNTNFKKAIYLSSPHSKSEKCTM